MKSKLTTLHLSLAVAAGLAASLVSTQAQDVMATGSLTAVMGSGGVYDYTLTLNNTGSEAIQSLWLGWALSTSPVFNIPSPTSPENNLGWNNTIDGNSVEFAGAAATAIPVGGSGTFTFDTTATPAQFMSGPEGGSVVYGVGATQFAIEDNSLHSEEFAPTVAATPEPSTISLLAVGSLGLVGALRRKLRAN